MNKFIKITALSLKLIEKVIEFASLSSREIRSITLENSSTFAFEISSILMLENSILVFEI